jgi:hypothetical protein
MHSSIRARFVATGVIALAALGTMSAAQARSNVYFSLGVQAPVYAEPAPVYVQPAPVYVQPQAIYEEPAPVYVPAPAYSAPPVGVYMRRDPYAYEAHRAAEWRHRYWREHHRHGWGRDWSRDRDWD